MTSFAAMACANDPQQRGRLIALIKEHRLPWEAVPTETTKDPAVWQAMLPTMGLTALIRNLGAMTSYGALKPLESEVGIEVAAP